MAGQIPFPVFKAARDTLLERIDANAKAWRAIPGNASGPCGLTPEHVKRSPEWQGCYREHWQAMAALQALNRANAKRFRRELSQERDAIRAARLASIGEIASAT